MDLATVPRPASEKVHLAVGDDVTQCRLTVRWALHFIPPHMLLVLVHIHRPTTPTVLGASVAASKLTEDHVSAHRISEKNVIEKNLKECLQMCKVQAEILIIDKDDVIAGLGEAVKDQKVTTLVMGVKRRKHGWKSKTADALEKQADCLCNILYLHEGVLVASRHQHTDRKIGMPSLVGCHFSGSNSNTTKSSSFFNSRSTADTFDTEHLDDPSLVMNSTYIYHDCRFNTIIGLKSFDTFKELVKQQILAEHSRDLYQAFNIKYCDIFTGCQLIGGFDSLIGVDPQHLGEEHWKSIKSWPAVLEYIVSVLKTLQMQLLMQNHRARNGFTHDDLSEAVKKPIKRLFTVASIVSDHEVRKSPEKLFCVLNMHTALINAAPTLRKVFSTKSIRDVLQELEDSVRGILKELKGLIHTYNSPKVVQDGDILPICGYLMRYIMLLVKHKGSLDRILSHDYTDSLLKVEGMSLTSDLVSGLITDLESVIDKHSKQCAASKGLQFIFLMNNIHFILQEVKQSDVQLTVKAKWFEKRRSLIKGYIKSYLSASWGPVTSSLEVAKSMPPTKKARINLLNFWYTAPPMTPLQSFASSFNEACSSQICLKVPSPTLRDELRVKILEFVSRAYHGHLASQRQSAEQNAREFESEWKTKISELFEG
ncbi:exocyst complex component EXO70A1-like [Triticum urartu]|nr:exocyst complex component EXO70A1-like [Triticum urartu]XP_048565753.1 exocyst complex component EXO70A1-like [Triticum urartu]